MAIKFLKLKDPGGFLSNFWPCTIYALDRTWKTSEHLYQALKFWGMGGTHFDDVCNAHNAWAAASTGRDRARPLRPDWEQVKDDAMRYTVALKFLHNPDLVQQLLDTGLEELVEHFHKDRYWADGGDGSGKNMLGRILMEIRSVLRQDCARGIELDDPTKEATNSYIFNAGVAIGLYPPVDRNEEQ